MYNPPPSFTSSFRTEIRHQSQQAGSQGHFLYPTNSLHTHIYRYAQPRAIFAPSLLERLSSRRASAEQLFPSLVQGCWFTRGSASWFIFDSSCLLGPRLIGALLGVYSHHRDAHKHMSRSGEVRLRRRRELRNTVGAFSGTNLKQSLAFSWQRRCIIFPKEDLSIAGQTAVILQQKVKLYVI